MLFTSSFNDLSNYIKLQKCIKLFLILYYNILFITFFCNISIDKLTFNFEMKKIKKNS